MTGMCSATGEVTYLSSYWLWFALSSFSFWSYLCRQASITRHSGRKWV